MNSYMYQGQSYTIQEMSTYLNLPIPIVMKIMNGVLMRMAGFFGKDGAKMQELARAEIFRSLFWATESHSLALKQARLLADSQGDTYKPFVSGEVNKAIANLISANKPLQELIKLMAPGSNGPGATSINIHNQNGTSVQYLSTDKAVALIRENSQSLITNTAAIGDLEVLQDKDIPDISARTQDLSKIGIRKRIEGPNNPKQSQYEHGTRDNLEIMDEDFRD